MHTLVLRGAILLPQSVSTLLSLQGRSLIHLRHINPKSFLYLGMKPSNWQGFCKLFLRWQQLSPGRQPISDQRSSCSPGQPCDGESLLHVILGFCRNLMKKLQHLSKKLILHQVQDTDTDTQRACKPWAPASPRGMNLESTVWATMEHKRVFSCRCNMNCPCSLF